MSTTAVCQSVPPSATKLAEPAVVLQDSRCSGNDGGDMVSEVPSWLTKDYMEQCLRKSHNDAELNIKDFELRPVLAKGDNYGGVLTRIRASYCLGNGRNSVSQYVIKTAFERDAFAHKTMQPYDIFTREMAMYDNVIPKLNALLQAAGDVEQLFAETLVVDSARSALLFEDLNVRAFVMPDRVSGLDMKAAKLVLRKLAKMHAASAVLNERECGCLESYDRGMFNRYTDNYAPGFVGLLEACERRVSQWGPEFKYYAQKLRALNPVYMELGKRVFDVVEGHFNVLAHGDLWTNNVMIKYDAVSGDPVDAILIDFQYTVWGSPAIDLFYFMNTSLEEEMHIERQDELIQHYYRVLTDTLRRLEYAARIPSLHHFHLQLASKSFYAFNSACIIQPVQRNEVTEDADFHALMKQDERGIRFKDTCYQNPYCQRMLRRLLPVYERKGLLDTDQ